MSDSDKPVPVIDASRRDILRYSAAGATGLLAGCGGGGGGQDTATEEVAGGQTAQTIPPEDTDTATEMETTAAPSGGSDEILDRQYRFNYANVQFNQVNLNPFNANSDWGLRLQLQQILAKPSPTHGKIVLHTVRDYEFKEDEFRIHFKMPWTWSNGDTAGAKDFVTQFQLDRRMTPREDRPDEPTIDRYVADGQETLILKLNPPYNKRALTFDVLTGYTRLDTYRKSPLADLNEALGDATTKSERKSIRQKVVQRTEGMGMLEHPVSGPWKIENARPSEMLSRLNTEHWAATTQGGPLNFSELVHVNLGDQSQKPAFQAGKLDISGAPLPRGATYPDNVYPVKASEYGGQGIMLNWLQDDFYAKPKVRQALAIVIDRKQVASNAGGGTNAAAPRPVSKPVTEMMPSVGKRFIPELWKKFRPFEHNEENLQEAEQLMQEAGLQKDGGEWYKPNGDRFKIPLLATQSTVATMETISQNFTNFGIQSEIQVVDGSTMTQRLESGNWTSTVNTWGEFAFAPLNYRAVWGPSGPNSPRGEGNPPYQIDVPMPPGKWDGELKTVDCKQLVQDISSAETLAENKEITRKLAWVGHYTQANFVLYTNASVTPVRLTDKWIYPEFNRQGWIRPSDPEVWGCDSPETSLIQGVGGGIKANPDWQG